MDVLNDHGIHPASPCYRLSVQARQWISRVNDSSRCCRSCRKLDPFNGKAEMDTALNSERSATSFKQENSKERNISTLRRNNDRVPHQLDTNSTAGIYSEILSRSHKQHNLTAGRLSMKSQKDQDMMDHKAVTAVEQGENFRRQLAWFQETRRYLDNLERLGYGMKHRRWQLARIDLIDKQADPAVSKVARVLKDWILFEHRFRRTYARVAEAYRRLRHMEMKINLLRTNSLHTLEMTELEGDGSSANVPLHNVGATCKSELYCKLASLWYTKLSTLRTRNVYEFRQYIIDAASGLRNLQTPLALDFIEEVDPTTDMIIIPPNDVDYPLREGAAAASFEFPDEDTPQVLNNTEEEDRRVDADRSTSPNECIASQIGPVTHTGVKEYVLEAEDAAAEYCEVEEPDDCESLVAETKEIFSTYCQERGISEEKSADYITRLTGLRTRLLPRFTKMADKMPIYCGAYGNILYEAFPGKTKVAQNNSYIAKVEPSHLATGRNGHRMLSPNAISGTAKKQQGHIKHHNDVNNLSQWIKDNRTVSLFARTNLTIVDAVRCTRTENNKYRKLIILSMGSIRSLFLNRGGAQSIANIDLSDIIKTESYSKQDDDSMDGSEESTPQAPRGISKSLMRALLTEDLAADEIDKILSTWFPPLRWDHDNSDPTVITDEEENDMCWYPSSINLTSDAQEIHKDTWLSRLRMFDEFTSRQRRNVLHENRSLLERRIHYDSSSYPTISDYTPLRALSDFRNHIMIKYTMKASNASGNFGWVQSLYGEGSSYTQALTYENDTTKHEELIFHLGDPDYSANAVLVPIHRGAIMQSEDYSTVADMCECTTDYIYPSPYEQYSFKQRYVPPDGETNVLLYTESIGSTAQSSEGTPLRHPSLGSVFFSRHSNLCLGSQWSSDNAYMSDGAVSIVLYLVCCDDNEDETQLMENPEDPENIRKEIAVMRPILEGLETILDLCDKFKVATLSIPVALRCFFKGDVPKTAYYSTAVMPSKDTETAGTYTRCLATATHLSTCLSRHRFPLAINMIFPENLSDTDVDKNAVSIFTNHLGTF